ncbi:hypothetical protein MUK42_36684 [Musa troglodytarum]|uniref:Uncharacterized protein n=1 Tax=Musa troglodytarum TaxID=320322 RepID=A0A9E7G1M4_9LILI|nr:hypothetical protein MUK42_36684 [Musa troglodytarum]
MRKFDPWPVFFERGWSRNWPFLVGFAMTGTLIVKLPAGLTCSPLTLSNIFPLSSGGCQKIPIRAGAQRGLRFKESRHVGRYHAILLGFQSGSKIDILMQEAAVKKNLMSTRRCCHGGYYGCTAFLAEAGIHPHSGNYDFSVGSIQPRVTRWKKIEDATEQRRLVKLVSM